MSPGLRDSLILLLTTAALTGLITPLVIAVVQTRNQKRLKNFETYVARRTKVIDDQAALLDRFADALWTYQLLLIAPLYYHQFLPSPPPASADEKDNDPYTASKSEYLVQAGLRLGTIRAEVGKAVRLVPPSTWEAMKGLYYELLLPLDRDATSLLLNGPQEGDRSQWSALQHRVLVDLAVAIDSIVERVAEDVGLRAMPRDSG